MELIDIIKQQNKIIEMMIIKLDHIDMNMFPNYQDETFNLNNKRDTAKNETILTDEIMDEFIKLRDILDGA